FSRARRCDVILAEYVAVKKIRTAACQLCNSLVSYLRLTLLAIYKSKNHHRPAFAREISRVFFTILSEFLPLPRMEQLCNQTFSVSLDRRLTYNSSLQFSNAVVYDLSLFRQRIECPQQLCVKKLIFFAADQIPISLVGVRRKPDSRLWLVGETGERPS